MKAAAAYPANTNCKEVVGGGGGWFGGGGGGGEGGGGEGGGGGGEGDDATAAACITAVVDCAVVELSEYVLRTMLVCVIYTTDL